MGVVRDKGPSKPRPMPPRPAPPGQPSSAARAAPASTAAGVVRTSAAASVPPAPRKEEERLRGNAIRSPMKTPVYTNIAANNASRINSFVAKPEDKDMKRNEGKDEQSDSNDKLILRLQGNTLNKDNDVTLTSSKSALHDRGQVTPQPEAAAPSSTAGVLPTSVVKNSAAAASTASAPTEEEEKPNPAATESPVNITKITTSAATSITEIKDRKENDKKNEQSDIDKTLILGLSNMTLNGVSDLNQQLKNLKIKDNEQDKEKSEDSELLSRGPVSSCSKGIGRIAPYPTTTYATPLYEQHIISSDNYGGGTVRYPNISQPNQLKRFPQITSQNIYGGNWLHPSGDCGPVINGNSQDVVGNEVEEFILKLSTKHAVLPQLSNDDVHECLGSLLDQPNCDSHSDHSFSYTFDEITVSKDDKDIQHNKQEHCKGAINKQCAPHTPDSAYESDESSIGSPSSTTSTCVMRDRDNVESLSAPPHTHVVMQQTTVLPQSGFPLASITPIIQTVPPGMFLVLQQQQQTVMPPPSRPPPPTQLPTQPLVPPSTPPLSPQILRPILPGISIPARCNECNEPAINRIRSVMVEQIKDRAWALIFTQPDEEFTTVDKDGNMFLSRVLSNRNKIENFIEVLHAVIQRLKGIIENDKQLACKVLATPNRKGYTPLDIACCFLRPNSQDALAVRYLADVMVEQGLVIGGEVDNCGNTLLHKICACGDKACYIMAELLNVKNRNGIKVFDVNKQNNEGKTPLHIAALTHSDQISCTVLAQLLMRSGAAASKQEGCAGNTVFHCVARESCDPDFLVTLLAKTSDVGNIINKINYNEDTPLHMVAANHAISLTRQRRAVQHLVDHGADPKLQNKSGKTPLSLVPADRKQDIRAVLYQK